MSAGSPLEFTLGFDEQGLTQEEAGERCASMGGPFIAAGDEPKLATIRDATEERFLLEELIPEALCSHPGYLMTTATGRSSSANAVLQNDTCRAAGWRTEVGAEGLWLGLTRGDDKVLRWANGAQLVAIQGTNQVLSRAAATITGALTTERNE